MSTELKETENNFETSAAPIANELSILDLLALMFRNWWILALVGSILGIATYAYSKTTSIPLYKSTGNLYIDTQREQKTDDVNANALLNAVNLMPTYIEILKSRTFFSMVSDSVDNKYSYEEISQMTSLTNIENTNIITISVTCVDQTDSYLICNSIVELASDEILRVFEGGSVKIIDRPEDVPATILPNAFRRGTVGFVVGVILATFVIFLINMFDTRIETSDELTARYNLPILGEIPNLSDLS